MVKKVLAGAILAAALSGCSSNDGIPQYQGAQKVDPTAGGKDRKDQAKAGAVSQRDSEMQAEIQKLGIKGNAPTHTGAGAH
ncbi:MAG: hypothetical protein P4L46_01525 [Fimbriimonas sp.]|nr:hypothetical protein [Fimbriimonas sp.]